MTSPSKSALESVLDRRSLRRLAGAASFERGEDYFAGGEVRALAEHEGTITAKVRGTREYRVKLWAEDGELDYSCTCPVGTDGAFCKHCVAVGLAWLEHERAPAEGSKKAARPAVTMDDVRAFLAGQDKNALVDLLMEQALDDERLRQRLLMKAAKKSPKGLDLATYREAIDNAVDIGEFVDYRSAHDYAQGIEEAIDSIEELLTEGHAAEVIELAEHALAAVEDARGSVDDSDGAVGGILARLQELHNKACRKARPDPEALARRLFEWELRAEGDTFFGAAATYVDILGKKGLAVYRKLAEAEWARVPALGPGRDDPERYGKRFRITHIMETLAQESGDVEALVAIKTRDLSSAYAYLQIAETYKQARQPDLALEWAERGLKAFPERTDPRLREFLADEYHRRKRHDEAMALVWAEFAESPDLTHYESLKKHADRTDQWAAWREKALAVMRETIARAKRDAPKNRSAWSVRADHSELVRVFLWEKDVEGAWREAKEGGCSSDLWMQLAARRENDHPQDSLAIFQKQVDPTLDQKNNDAYREAIGLLRKIQRLMGRLGRSDEFTRYLESVRAAHKPKRNFMKLLENAKWS
ncbi:MAG: SWIM zinc finger family protein [Candidatus Rokubacteria bacterium]|nr:SWIM zinc finger family protein [Candidatus Rokubacteria bacterium]